MVYKSPKGKFLGKQLKKKTPYPRVHVQKLDENVYEAYRNRLIGICGNNMPVKEERACIFSSELDINEHAPCHETSLRCQCNYCSLYHEMKSQQLDAAEDQENVGRRYPYLRDLVHENVDPYVQAPVAVELQDAETQTPPREYAFTCEKCNSQFNHQFYYELHLEVHAGKLHVCAFCNATYKDEMKLQMHTLIHKYKTCFECVDCNSVFAKKKQLMKHMATHKKIRFECAVCQAQFNNDIELQKHKKLHVSTRTMIHKFILEKTQSEPTDEVAVVETECANVYEEPLVIATSSTSFYKCDKCSLVFKNAGILARHNTIHNRTTADFLHLCSVCDARFRSKKDLIFHKRRLHKL